MRVCVRVDCLGVSVSLRRSVCVYQYLFLGSWNACFLPMRRTDRAAVTRTPELGATDWSMVNGQWSMVNGQWSMESAIKTLVPINAFMFFGMCSFQLVADS